MTADNTLHNSEMLDFSNIDRIRELRDQIFMYNREIGRIAAPIANGTDSLETLYGIYKSVIDEKKEANAYERKKFLMAVMYLFSPVTLAGGKMRSGLRQKLAAIMGVKNHTTLSANLQDVMMLYRTYRDFRRDVNLIIKTFFEKIS